MSASTRPTANTGEHIGSLWTTDGTLLAQATFTSESSSGWQQVELRRHRSRSWPTPRYVASYHTNTGHYSVDQGYFTDHGYTNDPLSAPGGDTGDPQRALRLQPDAHLPDRHLQRQQLLGRRRLHLARPRRSA